MSDKESEKNAIGETPKRYTLDNVQATPPSADPAADPDFIDRMQKCADLAGSVNALARKADLSQSGIRRYFTGGDPTRRVLIAIANAVGVDCAWLATGAGPMYKDAPTGPSAAGAGLDLATLRLAIETVEEALLETGRGLAPTGKAEMVAAVYELFRDGEGKIEKATVLRLVKSAS